MARYHATVESRRSATETFGYLATFSNAAQRGPGVHAGEQLDPGPAGAGSRFRLVVPFLGGHPRDRRRAPGLPPGHAADPALTRAGRRHDPLAGHRAAGEPGQQPVLARPARPARMPAAVDARDRPQHRTQVWDHLAAATGTDSPEAGAGRAGQRGCCSVISPRGQG